MIADNGERTGPEIMVMPLIILRQAGDSWQAHWLDCDVHDVMTALRVMLELLEYQHQREHATMPPQELA